MRLQSETCVDVKFLALKMRVAPAGRLTILRLELLSALLLSKLITSVCTALEPEMPPDRPLEDPACFSDSSVALYWIRGVRHEWKQFFVNRVLTIRSLVEPQHWRHCPGKKNPANIPSRVMSAAALIETPHWIEGPDWLYSTNNTTNANSAEVPVPDECLVEMKRKILHIHSLLSKPT